MSDWLNRCHFGDVRDVLRRMIADGVKVNTIITSPPYWGLRDYGHEGQIGLERTFPEFLATMVDVFDLARQVLADDGTAWVNMGDSYVGTRGAAWGPSPSSTEARAMTASRRRDDHPVPRNDVRVAGLKPKDLVGQPWRLAFALQDAGWWLRSDIIWHKPNPMPESVRDRPTKAHEYLFLLAKREDYFFDFEGWKEPVSGGAHSRRASNGVGFGHGFDEQPKPRQRWKTPDGWDTSKGEGGHGQFHRAGREKGRKFAEPGSGVKSNSSMDEAIKDLVDDRNRRTVWTIPTEAFKGAHFATYPQKLVEPCVLAGCPVGGTVLDIFFGSGTTGQVAQRLGRNWIGIELNPDNEPLQRGRLVQPGLRLEHA